MKGLRLRFIALVRHWYLERGCLDIATECHFCTKPLFVKMPPVKGQEMSLTINMYVVLVLLGFMLFLDLDDDATQATGEILVDMPDLFHFSGSYRMDKVKDLRRTVNDLQHVGEMGALEWIGGAAQGLQGAFARAELSQLNVSFKDKGMVKRSALLEQRYATPLDPTAGSADKQRQAWFVKRLDAWQKGCESKMRENAPMLSDGCELMVKLFTGKNDGIQLSIDPNAPVRVMDLTNLFGRGNGRPVLERLNPEVSSL